MERRHSVQSLDRGMRILALLASRGPLTASALGRELRVHQSSASRLLRGLAGAGFVRKPTFHSFALDYGVLLFAGLALERFPIVEAAVTACNDIHARAGLCAAVAMLRAGRLVYLARIDTSTRAATVLVDNSDFPLHGSSLGLILSHGLGRRKMAARLAGSLRAAGAARPAAEAARLCDRTRASLARHGMLYLRGFGRNVFNASIGFSIEGEPFALAVYSKTEVPTPARARAVLEQGKRRILDVFEQRAAARRGAPGSALLPGAGLKGMRGRA